MRKKLGFGQRLGYTVLAGAAMVASESASRHLINEGWRLTTSKPPPRNPARPGISWQQALAYGAITGATGGVVGVLARKAVSHFYYR